MLDNALIDKYKLTFVEVDALLRLV